ncbi:MAG TPA: hypothetical protein VG711_05665 [Phycisphaerales bacterium]|nr:hypothetical protein [Phycisphaerales bacterium]
MVHEPNQVEVKLDTVIKLLALQAVQGNGSLSDKAVTLQRVGIAPKEIASILGEKGQAIRDALYKAKRSNGKGKAHGSKAKSRQSR